HRLYIHRFHSMAYFLEFLKAVTGEELGPSELLRRGERIWNLYKLLNVRVGLTRRDDQAPAAWFEPKKIGDREFLLMDYYRSTHITREDTERMLTEYYEARGWDKNTGVPTPAKLKELALEDFDSR
ncbi:MAG: hypothetical protein JRH05_14110, partial [Deltaproteobacteria bacterium]|nr:hypothetical protein [Deltaproteobacteria bacterium]MBW2103763.1 hypothetical protein [Deltaproteobacteria bacterium]